jgi:hypothetical protein
MYVSYEEKSKRYKTSKENISRRDIGTTATGEIRLIVPKFSTTINFIPVQSEIN